MHKARSLQMRKNACNHDKFPGDPRIRSLELFTLPYSQVEKTSKHSVSFPEIFLNSYK